MFVRSLARVSSRRGVRPKSGRGHHHGGDPRRPGGCPGSRRRRAERKREPLVFTVDVAEDLAGKFVPTFVKPEHTQPERGSFFVTEG